MKISIIGAGSAVFSMSLVRDLCLTRRLKGCTVSLMDIDASKLATVHELCTRYAREMGAKLKIEKTTNRGNSLRGANFVVNSALAAGHHRLRDGWRIARRLGYRLGGSLHICHDESFWVNFHQLKLMESIQRDILKVCPQAWYILIANPVLAGTTYLKRKYPRAKIVGLCHGYGTVYQLAGVLGLDRRHLSFEVAGPNHFIWLTRFEYRGRSALPLLDRWRARKASCYWKKCGLSDPLGPKPFDLYRRFGAFPLGDTANPGGGAWPYWYHSDAKTEKRWREDPVGWYYDGYFKGCEAEIRQVRRVAEDRSTRVSDVWPPHLSGESAIPLIESIARNVRRKLIVNVINTDGLVPGMPRDFGVEVPAIVSGRGIRGMRTRRLPDTVLKYVHRDRVVPVETEIAAFAEGSRERLLQLILMDPWTKSEKQARALLDGILALPYHGEMRRHYR
jgi:alpha-galactosidase